MVDKTCENCSKQYEVYPYRKNTARFCSSHCSISKQREEHPEFVENSRKRGIESRGSKNHNWKGDKVSYAGIHMWLAINYIKTGACEECLVIRRTTWANISDEYKRDRDDWRELCYSCHKKYDMGKIKKSIIK